jgi:hypothetical protein
MEFDLKTIVHRERETSSGYHLLMGRGWRILGEQERLHSPLAYSAFEFRCAIERTLMELYLVMKNQEYSPADLKALQSFSGLRTAILSFAGGKRRLERMLLFNRLFCQASGAPKNVWLSIIDVSLAERYWSKLSEYCHRQLEPKATWHSMGNTWLLEGYKLLNDVEKFLWDIMVTSHIGWVQPSTMQPEVREIYQKFVSCQLTRYEVETRFHLMKPILARRARHKIL